jgi:probable addiction module antidote protein
MGRQETVRFDSANYLGSAEAIAAYLNVSLEDSTPEELRTALVTVARSHGISDLARRSGVSRPGIYKALGQGRESIVRDDPVDLERDGAAVDG